MLILCTQPRCAYNSSHISEYWIADPDEEDNYWYLICKIGESDNCWMAHYISEENAITGLTRLVSAVARNEAVYTLRGDDKK